MPAYPFSVVKNGAVTAQGHDIGRTFVLVARYAEASYFPQLLTIAILCAIIIGLSEVELTVNKLVYCKDCHSHDSWQPNPANDIKGIETGKVLWHSFKCRVCGVTTIIPAELVAR